MKAHCSSFSSSFFLKCFIALGLFSGVLSARAENTVAPDQGKCESIRKTIVQKISSSLDCKQDSECTTGNYGCPFGCETVVNKSQAAELTRMSHDYSQACPICAYECTTPPPGPARCIQNKCTKVTAQFLESQMPPLDPANCKVEQKNMNRESHKARTCKQSSDCAASPLGCPFGCHGLVNKSEHSRMQALYSRFDKACKACEYKCAAPSGEPFCLNKHCVWKE